MQTIGAALRPVGREPSTSRQIYLLYLEDLAEFPSHFELPCPRFVLFLAADFAASSTNRVSLAERILDAGCAYFCAWGPGCEFMHDLVDESIVERDLEGNLQGTIMTTWHSEDTLADAAEFTLSWALPDDALAIGCDAILLVAVGDTQWRAELEMAAAKRVG